MKLDGDRYEVLDELGRGTFARVYRGVDHKYGRPCAVKVLNSRAGQETRKRFVAEVRALARLRHPHILAVFGAGTHGDQGYVVTELASGGSLLDLVRKEGTLDLDDSLGWMVQTLSALAAAHASAVVHRDVKPSNILLDDEGLVRLGDFGIAMQVSEDAHRLTQTGTALGTTIYMAPEQRRDAKHVGPAADLYAIGTSIYRIVTGLNPQDLFAASNSSERWQRVPEVLRPVLRQACALEPEERYADAREMAEALLEIMSPEARARILALPSCQVDRFPAPSPRFAIEDLEPDAAPSPTPSWPVASSGPRPAPSRQAGAAAPGEHQPGTPGGSLASAESVMPSADTLPLPHEAAALPETGPKGAPPPAPAAGAPKTSMGKGGNLWLVAAVVLLLVICLVELALLATR